MNLIYPANNGSTSSKDKMAVSCLTNLSLLIGFRSVLLGKAIHLLPVLLQLKPTISRVLETLFICLLLLLLNRTDLSHVHMQIYILICNHKLGSIAIFNSISFAFYEVATSSGEVSINVHILCLL